MKRISTDLSLIEDSYQVVVIGSGYGGSICASRLARAGQQVCLLERGLEILPGDFPDTPLEAAEQLQIDTSAGKIGSPTGLYNIHVNKEQSVVVGCGLGGTSLINANVSLEPDPDVFAQDCWPQEIKNDRETLLKQGFDHAREMLKAVTYPMDRPTPAKLSAHQRSAEHMGDAATFYRPPINVNFEHKINHVGVEQPACNDCGDCVSGCNSGAKNTTLMNYLPDAYNHGAEIFCAASVKYIEQNNGRWVVHFEAVDAEREIFDAPDQFILADLVIVAAGTLGSTEILLRSKAQGLSMSEQLGKHFSGNGDILGFAYNCDQQINGIGFGDKPEQDFAPVGPCITSIIDLRGQHERAQQMVIEEGSVPSAIGALLPNALSLAANTVGQDTDEGFRDAFLEKMRTLQSKIQGPYKGAINNTQTYLIMSHDDSAGVMHLNANKLRISWPGLGSQPNFAQGNRNLYKATEALGGEYIKNPLWDKLFDYSLVTVHPLGGCVIARDASLGVTNHKGQVFTGTAGTQVYADLYVCDGASIPTSLAVNPLLTISAMTERCCEIMAKDRGWEINYAFATESTRPQTAKKLGIAFTETMKGFVAKPNTSNSPSQLNEPLAAYKTAYDNGKQQSSPFEFTLTISSPDLEQILTSPAHNARMSGTVNAPILSDAPLMVSEGVFNLFVRHSDTPDTKRMKYNMLLTSEAGDKFFFSAYKSITEGKVTDIWPATTTLYVDIYAGTNQQGSLIAQGILHIEPLDFAKQMTTMRATNAKDNFEKLKAIARFGQYFAGSLYQSYGGILYQQPLFNPEAPPRKKRPLRADAPQVHWFSTADGVDLRLTRYLGGNKGPVMLVHGLGVSSAVFSTDTIDTNLTEYLVANDYDVWLLDFRVSIDLPCAADQSDADQVAKYDFCAAINTIKEQTGCHSVQAIVHCYGATTFFMSLLTGLKDVRSVVCSQIATHLVIPKLTELKTGVHLPGFLEKLGVQEMSAYTDTQQSFVEKLFDRAVGINALSQAQGQCSSNVCHRITFLYASLFRHETLNQQLHENLHELFAEANISSLKHLAAMCRAHHLVDAQGADIYLQESNYANLDLPICFISGALNSCYLPESTQITYQTLCDKFDPSQYSRSVIPDYGHIDCIFGANAVEDVYPIMLAHLEKTASV